jgi:choline dehydrogenase
MWDYIVIGAGTAGSVLAHELTASGRDRVLLIEAGGNPNLMVRIPAGFPKLFRSKLDWGYQSEPQQGCDGRVVYFPRGKMLGGSSNMNAQIHQWGHPADFDGWAKQGARGWSWDDVAPTFRAMESLTGCPPDDQSRGALGPMIVGRPAAPHPLAVDFVAAAASAGLRGEGHYNGARYNGAWLTEQAHRRGSRFSAYDAYLKPAMHRANLRVIRNAHATGLLFEGRRAVGVRTSGAGDETHRAARGIILAAGAIGSPHILMLSGIGPAEQLRSQGIGVVRDAAGVGANLQDHPLSGLKFRTRRPITMKGADGLWPLLQWLVARRGPLASSSIDAFAFTNVLGGDAPDLELLFGPLDVCDQLHAPPAEHAYSIATIAISPKSRGSIRLRSGSARDAPIIDLGFLTDPAGDDARVLVAGARLARSIAAAEPLASQTIGEFAESASAESDEALLAYLKTMLQTVYHPCGTCRMGSDDAAVVEPDLRVKGIDGLWVADASVMPSVPRGHPNAAVAMIAKRGAEMIHAAR